MKTYAGIEATLLWRLMSGRTDGLLHEDGMFSGGYTLRDEDGLAESWAIQEPAADYAGMLEGMEASQLLRLMTLVKERLKQLEIKAETVDTSQEKLFIGRNYSIRMGSRHAPEMPFRPLVKALFILFLKHPEGIVPKERGRYERELEAIYEVIAPNVDPDDRRKRITRLMNLEDNSFSEKTSVLNATLDKLVPGVDAEKYKVQGHNRCPRRIPLDRMLIEWER